MMKRSLKNIILVVVAVLMIAPTSAFAAKEETKSKFSFWKPWTYFRKDNDKDEDKYTPAVKSVDVDSSESDYSDESSTSEI